MKQIAVAPNGKYSNEFHMQSVQREMSKWKNRIIFIPRAISVECIFLREKNVLKWKSRREQKKREMIIVYSVECVEILTTVSSPELNRIGFNFGEEKNIGFFFIFVRN